jgi:N-acetylneuraminate synthase
VSGQAVRIAGIKVRCEGRVNEEEGMTVSRSITISGRQIGPGHAVYFVAEMSANHNQDFDEAVRIIRAAKEAGADAVKLQTYTPDTMTIRCDSEHFRIGKGTPWEGQNLYELYGQAYTPWDWQPKLKEAADELGLALFSTAFDETAVDFLEEMDVPVHKVASFENVDIPLARKMARTGKPLIISTGMAELGEIETIVGAAREAGAQQIALLKCTSAYPAPAAEMNLRTIPHLAEAFDVPTGLSDHTLGIAVPVAAVALGACMVEKHFTLSREVPGPDSAFSLEPHELKSMIEAVRVAEKSLGTVCYQATQREAASRVFRRSLFVVEDVRAGAVFTERNVRSIRPGHGLLPRYLDAVLGRKSSRDVAKGTPLSWELLS